MKFTSHVEAAEFAKQYSDTYLQIRAPDLWGSDVWKPAYFQLNRDEPDRIAGTDFPIYIRELTDREIEKVPPIPISKVEIDTTYPKSGVVYIPPTDEIVLLERNAKRQWKWGLCRSNTHVWYPLSRIFMPARKLCNEELFMAVPNRILPPSSNETILTRDIARWALNRTFDAPEVGLTALFDGTKVTSGLSENFFLSQSYTDDNVLIWYRHRTIAEINRNRQIRMRRPLFQQELQDWINRVGLRNWTIGAS